MADIKAGFYTARGVAGSAQYGFAQTGAPQVAVDVVIPSLDTTQTVVLQFGGDAGKFSVERLRALGWKGDDVRKLDGIDKEDVTVELFFETFDGRARLKCEIRTSSTFKLKELMSDDDTDAFAADVKQLVKTGTSPARLRGT